MFIGVYYESTLKFFGFIDPSPEGAATTKVYFSNTVLDKNENNWGGASYYVNGMPVLISKVQSGQGVVVDTSKPHGKFPAYFLEKYISRI
jgi:hypothetical protein